jgi:hypothetical protein
LGLGGLAASRLAWPFPRGAGGTSVGGDIKWNPGHYMASTSIVGGGTSVTTWPLGYEISAIAPYSNIIGYRVYINWNTLESATQGTYNFPLIDNLLTSLRAMSPPRHLVIVSMPGFFSGGIAVPPIPAYILNNSSYGPSPMSGSYGWWGNTTENVSCAAVHRTAVATAWGQMLAAFAAHYDSEPLFEGIMTQETAWMVDALFYGGSDFTYPSFVSGMQTALGLVVASATHSNVACQNTWVDSADTTIGLEQWMYSNRILAAETDGRGQGAGGAGVRGYSYGILCYQGNDAILKADGATLTSFDMRPAMRCWVDIEPDDLGAYGSGGTPYASSVADFVSNFNNATGEGTTTGYGNSHAFWSYMPDTSAGNPAWTVWSTMAPVINMTLLTNTAYPTIAGY